MKKKTNKKKQRHLYTDSICINLSLKDNLYHTKQCQYLEQVWQTFTFPLLNMFPQICLFLFWLKKQYIMSYIKKFVKCVTDEMIDYVYWIM